MTFQVFDLTKIYLFWAKLMFLPTFFANDYLKNILNLSNMQFQFAVRHIFIASSVLIV